MPAVTDASASATPGAGAATPDTPDTPGAGGITPTTRDAGTPAGCASVAYTIVCDALRRSADRMAMLHTLAALALPDAWIAAGAIRNAVWDARHHYPSPTRLTDVDVIWFDPARASPEEDQRLEQALAALLPDVPWSVKNQARMHTRNADPPYTGCDHAMRFWPETATAVAARLRPDGAIALAAPFGLDDLCNLTLRPTPRFTGARAAEFHRRITAKGWLQTWPRLQLAAAAG
jgi:hypothetical protein